MTRSTILSSIAASVAGCECGTAVLPALLAVALLTAACATPVGITRVGVQTAYRERVQSALTGQYGAVPQQVLQRLGLADRFEKDPEAVLATLHQGLAATGDEDRLFALAELSFFHARRTGKPEYYLASAVYAYALLFPGTRPAAEPDPAELSVKRLALLEEIYNLGLTEGPPPG